MRAVSLIVASTAIVVLAVGCGSESGTAPDSAPDPGSTTEPGSSGGRTELEITFWPQGRSQGVPETWTLRCDPPGGTHPRADEACRQLGALDDPFAPPPADQVCTQQYGGPEEASVTGTYRGESVSATLSRTNGCEIGRFEQLGFLLPASGRA